MELTWGQLKSLWGNYQIIILSRREETKTVYIKLPFYAGKLSDDSSFPKYLEGYEKCYRKSGGEWNDWVLTEEAKKFRDLIKVPFEVKINIYDVKITEEGKAEIQRRYNIHKRNMEKYAKLLEALE